MNKVNKVVKGVVLSIAAVLLVALPCVAAGYGDCMGSDKQFDNLKVGSPNSTYKVKCFTTHNIDANGQETSSMVTIYAKESKDCAQAGNIVANPDTCKVRDLNTVVQTIINGVIFVVGILAVVMVILGGVNYTMSQGDSSKVGKAKSTIMYGLIGLVVSMLAFAIVNFVLQMLD